MPKIKTAKIKTAKIKTAKIKTAKTTNDIINFRDAVESGLIQVKSKESFVMSNGHHKYIYIASNKGKKLYFGRIDDIALEGATPITNGNLAQLDLTGLYSHENFINCDFSGSTLNNVDLCVEFDKCCFDSAKLDGLVYSTEFSNCTFKGARINFLKFDFVTFTQCDFTDTQIVGIGGQVRKDLTFVDCKGLAGKYAKM